MAMPPVQSKASNKVAHQRKSFKMNSARWMTSVSTSERRKSSAVDDTGPLASEGDPHGDGIVVELPLSRIGTAPLESHDRGVFAEETRSAVVR